MVGEVHSDRDRNGERAPVSPSFASVDNNLCAARRAEGGLCRTADRATASRPRSSSIPLIDTRLQHASIYGRTATACKSIVGCQVVVCGDGRWMRSVRALLPFFVVHEAMFGALARV
eukprot:m.242771 g.242771  ORF g.242771 m.242771 type:complete len:117 (-) comp15337_c1_seq10:2-352(-)